MKRATPDLCRQTADLFNRKNTLPAGFSVRFCGRDDLEEVLAAGRACFAYNAPTRSEILHALTRTHGGVFGLYDDKAGALAGYMLLEAHGGRKNLYINTTTLLETYRGRGLGQALYDFKEFFAKALEARTIWCHVAFDNKVNIHLMEKNGYAVLRREEEYYEDGKAALVMGKTL